MSPPEQTPDLAVLIAGLVRDGMALDGQQVTVYNEKVDIPKTAGLFVAVSYVSSRVIGNNRRYENDPLPGGSLNEVLTQEVRETYQLDLMSRDNSARLRKHEALFALNNTASLQLQEAWSFRIFNVPMGFIDVSAVEGAGRLNRYAITFNVMRAFIKVAPVEYYDQFKNPPENILINA